MVQLHHPEGAFRELLAGLTATDSIFCKASDQGVLLCNIPVEEENAEDVVAKKVADQDMLVLLELKKLLFISDKKLVDIHLPGPSRAIQDPGPSIIQNLCKKYIYLFRNAFGQPRMLRNGPLQE